MNSETIRLVFSKITGIEDDEIEESLMRVNTEGWDSFNHLLIIMELEKQLGIKLAPNQSEEIKTFGDLMKYFNSDC